MVFASATRRTVIMKVIVSTVLVIATIIAIWGAGCMVDLTVHMVCFLH